MSLIVFVASAILIGQYMMESYKNSNKQDQVTDMLDDLNTNSEDGQLVDRYASIRDKYKNLVGRLIIKSKHITNSL